MGGVYAEDKQWYRCRVKELIEEDKVLIPHQQFASYPKFSI